MRPVTPARLRVLVVDDEPPAREELVFLLGQDPRVGEVLSAGSGQEALDLLGGGTAVAGAPGAAGVDGVFLDIRMPGMSGLELAVALDGLAHRPALVFVTAYEDHAVSAFELEAVDYLLKPVRTERLAEAVRRIAEVAATAAVEPARPDPPDDEAIAVELGGVTRFVARSEVRFVEAHGDYARLFTATGSHLVRVPLATLEERWRDAGFVRIHRRHLVALAHVEEVRMDAGHASVRLGDRVLDVSRRHHRDLRALLARRAGLGTRPVRGRVP